MKNTNPMRYKNGDTLAIKLVFLIVNYLGKPADNVFYLCNDI